MAAPTYRSLVLSFASPAYYRAQCILRRSARCYVDGFLTRRDVDLPRWFLERNRQLFAAQRGFGYWVWKPFVILEALRSLKDGDVLMYVDSGNRMVDDPGPLLDACASSDSGILLFRNAESSLDGIPGTNAMWTRRDCFVLMGADSARFHHGEQVAAGWIIVQRRNETIEFIQEWLRFCENYQIIGDAPSVTGPEFPEFFEHRHDQSVLSILAIKHEIPLLAEPCQHADHVLGKDEPSAQIFEHFRSKYCPAAGSAAWRRAQLESFAHRVAASLRGRPRGPNWFRRRTRDVTRSVPSLPASSVGTVINEGADRIQFLVSRAWARRLPAGGSRVLTSGLELSGTEFEPGGRCNDAAVGNVTVKVPAEPWSGAANLKPVVTKRRLAATVLVVEVHVTGGPIGIGVRESMTDAWLYRRELRDDARSQEVWIPIDDPQRIGHLVIHAWGDGRASTVEVAYVRLCE